MELFVWLMLFTKTMIKKIFLFIGISFIVISVFLSFNIYCNSLKLKNIEKEGIENYIIKSTENISEESEKVIKENTIKKNVNYYAVLEIPKINLKKGLYEKNSYMNNVNRSVYILKESVFPNEQEISNIYLASHSGNSKVSYFKNLYKVNINDYIYLFFNGNKYIYEVYDKYEIDKKGLLHINKTDKSNITLITCKVGTDKQYVFNAELKQVEKY